MPRKIAPRPATREIPPTIELQHVKAVRFWWGTSGTAIDSNKIAMTYEVQELTDAGVQIQQIERTYYYSTWPQSLRDKVAALREEVVAFATGAGDLDSGTDEGEL